MQLSHPLYVTKRLCITPLVEMHTPTFQQWYCKGVYWCHHERKENGPLHDCYLADCLFYQMKQGFFHGQHDEELYQWIALGLDMIHGGILLPDGTRRSDATSLVTLHDREARRGYEAGREFFFLVAETDEERHYTDVQLVERIKESASECVAEQRSASTWYFTIGSYLGELSGPVFPWIREEHARALESKQAIYSPLPERCLATRQFSPVTVS